MSNGGSNEQRSRIARNGAGPAATSRRNCTASAARRDAGRRSQARRSYVRLGVAAIALAGLLATLGYASGGIPAGTAIGGHQVQGQSRP